MPGHTLKRKICPPGPAEAGAAVIMRAMLDLRIQQHFIDSADLHYQVAEALAKPVDAAVQAVLASVTGGGKVLHINDDGTIPRTNPFVGTANARPDVYSFGHRSSLGLTVHPATGALWQNENGPNGGDEINIIEAGKNYGWPMVSLGRDYSGPWQSDGPNHLGYQPPVVYWTPAIAVSGMTFYTSDVMPKWKGGLFVGSLRTGEIPGTGHLERIVLNEKYEELRRETLLVDMHQRMRDVRQGPDGFLYVATEERDGVVLRIRPAQ